MYENEVKLQFQIKCDKTAFGEEVFVIGETLELGNWSVEKGQRLYGNNFPIWQSQFFTFKNKVDFEYKYIYKVPEEKNKDKVNWEEYKGNRKLKLSDFKDGLYLIDDGNFSDKNSQKIIHIDENKKDDNIPKYNFNNSSKKGLENIGATCYMNSTLQCFCHIEKFIKFFKYNPQIINDKRKDTLAYSFKLLISKLWPDDSSQNNYNYFSPYEFKEKISKMNPLFNGIAANDAKDLVNFIIMQLHDELNKANINSINDNNNLIIDQTNPQLTLQYFVENFKARYQSIMSDIFYAMNNTITECGKCRIKLYNFQVYFFLVFPLEEVRKFKYPNNNNYVVSIFDCFDYDRKINYMSGQNKMYCNYCKMNNDSQMTTLLMTGPEILILLLNRGKGIEFNVKIIFEEYLDLYNYIEFKNTGFKYKLIGVITHIGESGMGGHFIAYCREPGTNSWSKYNDAIVTDVNDFNKEVINFANPYLLFYQKYM